MRHIPDYIRAFSAPLLAVAVLVFLSASLSYGGGKNGRPMRALWREYERYEAEDMPAKAEKVLREIVDKAVGEKSYKDFADACVALGSTVRSYDWKAAGKLRVELREKAEALGNPLVTLRLALSDVIDMYVDPQWVEAEVFRRKDALKAGHHTELYGSFPSAGNPVLQDFLLPAIKDDYEFLLWSLYGAGRGWNWCCRLDEECSAKILEELRSEVGGSYPCGAWLEYQEIVREDDCGGALEEFASKWDGKAVAVFARGKILEDRFSAMCEGLYGDAEGGLRPSSRDFVSFRSGCEEFERRRKAFRGKELDVAECYVRVGEIIGELDSEALSVSALDGRVRVVAKNVGKVVSTLSDAFDGAVVHSAALVNAAGSYFVADTLCYDLPEIPDGNYILECLSSGGQAADRVSYGKHTLSAALRRIAVPRASAEDVRGLLDEESGDYWETGVYVTDYLSGKPLEKADVEVSFKGRNVLTVKDFPLAEHFVPLTSVIACVGDSLRDGRAVLKFSCCGEDGLRRESEELTLWDASPVRTERSSSRIEAVVLSDRGAYNPGETVRFKSVLYEVLPDGRMSALAQDQGAEAVLLGPKRTEIARVSLLTNDFGSVYGAFELGSDAKGGIYLINVVKSGRILASKTLRVDELVLPTWRLDFDRDTSAYFDGDVVNVGGTLKSYSGHSLSGASLRYNVRLGGETIASGDVAVQDGGRFSFPFRTLDTEDDVASVYDVEVVVSDLTGETLQWSRKVVANPAVRLSLTLENRAEGDFRMSRAVGNPPGNADSGLRKSSVRSVARESSCGMPTGDSAVFRVAAFSAGGFCPLNEVEYKLLRGKELMLSGKTSVSSSGNIVFDLSSLSEGMYRAVCTASYTRSDGKVKTVETYFDIFRSPSADGVLDCGEGWFFKKGREGISAIVGSSEGGQWIVAELYDGECHLLDSKNIYLSGRRGEKGSVADVSFDYKDEYPSTVLLSLLCFRDAQARTLEMEFSRQKPAGEEMRLSFDRFSDSVLPGASCTMSLLGDSSAEYAVTVFDVSTETFGKNVWRKVGTSGPPFERVWCRTFTGKASSGRIGFRRLLSSSAAAGSLMMAKKTNSADIDGAVPSDGESFADDFSVEELPAVFEDDIRLREDFEKTLMFCPVLRPDSGGKVSFGFDSGDALGTYAVSVFAHDRNMRTAAVRREFLVTCPVKVSVVPPAFLYEGDVCRLRVAVANSGAEPVGGILSVSVSGGDDHRNVTPMLVRSTPLDVPADGQSSSVFEIAVPSSGLSCGCLGLKVVFRGSVTDRLSPSGMPRTEVSDGMFLTIPVLEARQELTEAHSALLLPGADRDSLKNVLMSSFTGTSPVGAEYSEHTLSSLVLRDMEQSASPASKDLVSLLSAYYSRAVLSYIRSGGNSSDEGLSGARAAEDSGKDLEAGIFACRNADGGFAWFSGFPSSPVLTALVLERFASLRDICSIRPSEDLEASVRYLDGVAASEIPQWRGGITTDRYLYVRSMYGYVPFSDVKGLSVKQIRKCLIPGSASRQPGTILENALRASTLVRLSAPDCPELISAWGFRTTRKLAREASRLITSLADHSVSRPDGAVYFPNAVMPRKGLLESEAYAHTILCNLFSAYPTSFAPGLKQSEAVRCERIADGLRLWLMLQKESQKWSGDPACADAALAVLGGSDKVLSAKMSVMTKRYSKPFGEILAAGNGMKVLREFYRESSGPSAGDDGHWIRLNEGDTLALGEKILSVIRVWSAENRSFVMLDAPRHACMRPVGQLSGISGGWLSRPFLLPAEIPSSGTPFSYREVKADRTQWYMDVCPEEWSLFCEEYFVVCGGEFACPAVSVESLYAPHYRANSNFSEKKFAD
ncbi:MAG: MG2 domain-containing protein [Candidatus Cryptobacteroides sp.]